MKALTVRQPWAQLIVLGRKCIETRSRDIKYRGPVLIHAAISKSGLHLCKEFPFSKYLENKPFIALGAIIGVANLYNCFTVEALKRGEEYFVAAHGKNPTSTLNDEELAFGDYSPGRFGWMLQHARAFKTPIPAKGQLGLWNYNGPIPEL